MFASRSYFHYRILGKRIPFLCQTNLSLSLCGLLSFHRAIESTYRMYPSVPAARKIRAAYFHEPPLLPARSISIVIGTGRLRDRTIENLASGCTRISRFTAPPTPTPSCFPCVPVDVAASVCPRRVPEIFHLSSSMYMYICIHRPLR